MSDERNLSGILDNLYEAACDPKGWQRFLDSCCLALEAQGGMIFATGAGYPPAASVGAHVGMDLDLMAEYEHHYHETDLRLHRMLAQHPGGIATSEMLIGPKK